MSNIFNAIKLFEEEQQAQTNASTYMQVKTLVDKMDKGGKKRVADALKKSLGVVTESAESIQQQIAQLEHQKDNLEVFVNKARQITKSIKYDTTVSDIIVQLRQLAEKGGVDMRELEYAEDSVREAQNALQSAVYGLDEVFVDALKNVEYKIDDLNDQLNYGDVDEAVNPAQQAAIAINMKKHHQKPKSEGVAEGSLEEYGDTNKGQKMLGKVHQRAADRVTSKQADKDPAYARKAQQTQDRAWDRLAVKEQGVAEEQHSCPHCGGKMVSEELMNEEKDACYYKVKSRYKVWPSAYASGALVKCRKAGASNWGNKSKK